MIRLVEILVNDAVVLLRNVERPVRILIADCPNHNDLVGEILEMIEEAGDVVFRVADNYAQAQFLFHFLAVVVMRERVGGNKKPPAPFETDGS